ncbi:MAG: hypothetical protein ACLPLR_06025 [Terriglobales bacterium]
MIVLSRSMTKVAGMASFQLVSPQASGRAPEIDRGFFALRVE